MRSVLWLLPLAFAACTGADSPTVIPVSGNNVPPVASPPVPGAPSPSTPGTAGVPATPPQQAGAMQPGVAFPPASATEFEPDARPVISAQTTPPAISGGTLLILADGITAVAADSDRDRISVVNLADRKLLGQVALDPAAEPGRLVEDSRGQVHVVLRGSGELATLDIAKLSVRARAKVCDTPRGVAYDAAADTLHVACMSGQLVSLNAATLELTRTVPVATDLRDVVVHDGRLLVTQFRAANLLALGADGQVLASYRPADIGARLALGKEQFTGNPGLHRFAARVVRRAVALPGGRTLLLHQRAMTDTVDVKGPDDGLVPVDENEPVFDPGFAPQGGGYGSGDSCQSIVQTAVSIVDEEGDVLQTRSLSGSVLPVDVAVSKDGMVAVANAGVRDPRSPGRVPLGTRFDSVGSFFGPASTVSMIDPQSSRLDEESYGDIGDPCSFGGSLQAEGQPTAVAFTPDGTLVVQSREPAELRLHSADAEWAINLGGRSVADTGHDLFHRDSGGGIACGSCHAEGGDDAHTWDFHGFGLRRTQSLNIGLRDTAPFHWSGDMPSLDVLMGEVFVNRMGGVPQSEARVAALGDWIFAQHAPVAIRAADDPAVAHGKSLFESETVGCGKCHNGAKLTNNKSEDVGTGGVFQVPSLVGIAYRAPFIHTGCAPTLRERFDPNCGGDKHGNTLQLAPNELDDLIAYLESL